ncbi:MAG: RsmD family RNA methyltransferase [Meiothermus sp.]|uniref:RsmD family RNA methyltransferase n=1 Tax=Meiothermus sp. TaxID=1955249 RepID=UPI00298EF819|nr:RsmD family RNA methyltransferase [Meiothermus sp.]MDW8426220.1 RsmD family RNA methyltransferase [Meiothermus sp.]
MLRILGGTAKGVALKVPESARPSPVRLRKALFDYLRYRYPHRGRFLDLYAGSGAIGLEAASEGFEVTLVEKDRQAIQCLRENASKARLKVQIEAMPVERYLMDARRRGLCFTVAFMAPPYPHDLLQDFERLLEARIVEPEGLYILQHPSDLALPMGERREYGFNSVTIIEASALDQPAQRLIRGS